MIDNKEIPQGATKQPIDAQLPTSLLTPEQAAHLSETDEALLFDRVFAVDREQDAVTIQTFVGRVLKNPRYGRMASEWDFKGYKEQGGLKYTDEQLAAGQWEEEDYNLAVESLRQDKITKTFDDVTRHYEPASPIHDSIVRLDQEEAIANDLENGKPVLIRGNWRVGKTSMAFALIRHKYGEANSVFIDAMVEMMDDETDIDKFKQQFGSCSVAEFIAKREYAGEDRRKQYEEETKLSQAMQASGKTPFEYLDEYLSSKGETAYVALDEVIGYHDQPERLQYLAGLKNYKNIKPAIILHRFQQNEEEFREIFDGYTPHFIRPLTVAEVGLLVRQPLAGTSIQFTEDAIKEIAAFTGGRPMEINNICRALFDSFSEHKKQKLVYRASDIQELTGKETWQLGKAFTVAIDTYMKIYKRSLSEDERILVGQLVKSDGVPIGNVDINMVQPLIDTTFVRKDEQAGVYKINGELFRKVISEELEELDSR